MSAWKVRASKGGDGNYEKAPPGNHPAVLVAMVDMGTQENEFKGEVTEQHRVFFVWELVTEKTQAGKNHLIGIDLTLSLNEKAKLRGWVEARLGRPLREDEEYEVSQELGQPCLLNVVEKNGYPKIGGVSAVPKGMTVQPATYPLTTWHLGQYEQTGKIEIPGWIPWLYGEPLSAHISRCQEIAEGSTASSNGQTKPAAPPAPAAAPSANRPAPPQSSRPAPPSSSNGDALYWVDLGNGQVSDQPMNTAGVGQLLLERGLKAESTQVLRDGTSDWKAASAFGIGLPF